MKIYTIRNLSDSVTEYHRSITTCFRLIEAHPGYWLQQLNTYTGDIGIYKLDNGDTTFTTVFLNWIDVQD